jgi:outer membrane receptor protein involved in Fe transport
MKFDFLNYLDNNTIGQKEYSKITPKIGFTYDLGKDKGFYANYSQGFSPPNLTAIFRKTPSGSSQPFYYDLSPAYFSNQEIGGWASFLNRKIYLDWAIYSMTGHNELLSIRQPDNSIDYQSAGKTLHQGIEYSLTFRPNAQWFFRFGGTNAVHRFVEFTLSTKVSDPVKNVNDKDMPSAPPFVANTEISYKPTWAKGLKMSLEWQRMSAWYQNAINTIKYEERSAFGLKGVSFLNFRTSYHIKSIEIYGNIMNLSNELYATQATRGNSLTDRSFYYPAAPRTFVMGIQYGF